MGPRHIFCGLLALTTVCGGRGFYFPDQVEAKAQSKSESWSDGLGNSQASAQGSALGSRAPRYPQFYAPDGDYDYGGGGFGHQNPHYSGSYPVQGPHRFPAFSVGPTGPYEPYRPHDPTYPLGQSSSNSLANSHQSAAGGGSSVSNSVSGSQSLGPSGESSAAAAAASAGTGFVNGVPVSSAAAASSASSASQHGGSSVSSSSNTNGIGGSHYPRPHYPGYQNGPYGNYYGQSQFQPWLRSRGSFSDEDSNESEVNESAAEAKADRIVFGND